jgi:hypothetical protein
VRIVRTWKPLAATLAMVFCLPAFALAEVPEGKAPTVSVAKAKRYAKRVKYASTRIYFRGFRNDAEARAFARATAGVKQRPASFTRSIPANLAADQMHPASYPSEGSLGPCEMIWWDQPIMVGSAYVMFLYNHTWTCWNGAAITAYGHESGYGDVDWYNGECFSWNRNEMTHDFDSPGDETYGYWKWTAWVQGTYGLWTPLGCPAPWTGSWLNISTRHFGDGSVEYWVN